MIAALAFIACFIYAVFFPLWEAKGDYEKIQADGSKDSLKEAFHRRNLIERGLMLLGVSCFANLYIEVEIWQRIILAVAFLIFAGTWFGVAFNTHLSTLRGLDPWYVSRDDRAAKTDQLLVKYAYKFNMEPETFHKRLYGGALIIAAIIFILAYTLILFL